jgi:hypothetical protein
MSLRVQLLGLVGSGKTHIARELARSTNGRVVAFAEGVYRLAEIAKGGEINKLDPADRTLLKVLGTAWGREGRALPAEMEERLARHKPAEWGSADIWAKLFIANCRHLRPDIPVFNDDTRFENELRLSSSEAGFIPVFVKVEESTRLVRLKQRGDVEDPNDPEHTSELLSNLLNRLVLDHDLLPVVWNDDEYCAPRRPWVWPLPSFQRIVLSSETNTHLAEALGWTGAKRDRLLQLAAEATRRNVATTSGQLTRV